MSGPQNRHGQPAAAGAPITFSLNGAQVQAEAGQTILEAAKAKGVPIPTLCHHPALEAYGGCRLCMVEVAQGRRKRLVTSCNYEVREGLEVQTDSERVHKSRRMSLELLLARCPEVESIRELAGKYGVTTPRFELEKDDCILCGLCVRICRERMGPGVADFVGRGADIRVDTPYHRGSEVCLECGACESVCPTHSIRLKTVYEVPPVLQLSEFDQRLRQRPTIYIPFPQALPNAPVLDRSNCVRFRQAERGVEACGICAEACPVKAIDYGQTDQTVQIEAGAVILAPGFCAYDPAGRPELHYGTFPNVVSSLQFERILSASGPYLGKVLRPSDFRKPRRIAFIQCVGSRDEDHNYCSSVCCMYAIKEAIIAKEHEEDLACEVFYMDVRAHGKGFDAYYERAKELGIVFTRCRPSKIEEIQDRSLSIGYVGEEDQRYHAKEFDLVVLSVGLEPPAEARELAKTFGIELNAHGFAATRPFDAVATSREGVLVAGPFAAPKDIPETVMESSGAAARAMVALAPARGTLVQKKELVPERNVIGRAPAHRRVRLPLREQHRRRGERALRGRIRPPLPHVVFADRQHLHLLLRHAGGDQGEDRGAPPEPGGRGLLLAAHPRAAVPADHPRGGAEPEPVRDGQHPRPVLLGAHARAGRGHGQGQGPGAHGRGQGRADRAAGLPHPAGDPDGPGAGGRGGGPDRGPGPGRPGLPGQPGGEDRPTGRQRPARGSHPGGPGHRRPRAGADPAGRQAREDHGPHQRPPGRGGRLRGQLQVQSVRARRRARDRARGGHPGHRRPAVGAPGVPVRAEPAREDSSGDRASWPAGRTSRRRTAWSSSSAWAAGSRTTRTAPGSAAPGP